MRAVRIVIRAAATNAQADAIKAQVEAASGLPVDTVHKGLPNGAPAWRCSRATPGQSGACGWYGDAQTGRPSWATQACPRCGVDGCVALVAPTTLAGVLWLRDGDDVPDGVQPEELLGVDVAGLPVSVLRAIRNRLVALEARIAALEGG